MTTDLQNEIAEYLSDAPAPAHTQLPNPRDHRLYLPYPEGWEARIKRDWDKDSCYAKNPGEDFFHLLQNGEIYVQRGTERYCLNCALRLRILSEDRLHWQHRPDPPAASLESL